MKKTGYIYHPIYLEHETGSHPENPGRLRAITRKLEESSMVKRLHKLEPRQATDADIVRNQSRRSAIRARAGWTWTPPSARIPTNPP